MRLLARGIAAAALLLAPLAVVPSAAAAPTPPPAPLYRSDHAVPDQYIITLDNSVDTRSTVRTLGIKPMFTYNAAMRGFAAVLTSAQLDTVRRTPGVAAVEENATATAFHTTDTAGATAATVPASATGATGTTDTTARTPRTPAPRAAATSWGLDRIDQRLLPLDGRFTTTGHGAGTTAYIEDTGIDFGHSEFGGRAVPGFDAVGDGRNGQDCHGHGTHVAGTVGGATFGIAPQARLVSVRVLGCDGSGTNAGVIAGFDWVAQNAVQPAVLNASLGGSFSPAVNAAVDSLAASGVLPVIAAGNSTEDACRVSPASATGAFTIGATDPNDDQTGFSNFGRCLSMYAPGLNIVSARLGGGSVTLSGTSMSSPHVAGVALLYKELHPTASATEVGNWLDDQSTKDVLTVDSASPNRLLYTGGL